MLPEEQINRLDSKSLCKGMLNCPPGVNRVFRFVTSFQSARGPQDDLNLTSRLTNF